MRFSFVKAQKKLAYAIFFSQFLFLLSFINISGMPVNLSFIFSVCYILISLIGIAAGKIKPNSKKVILGIAFYCLFIFNILISEEKANIKSFGLYIFYFSLYFLTDGRIKGDGFKRIMKTFVIICTVIGVYAVYQFIAYNFITSLPLKELIPENLWASNYNVVQSTRIPVLGMNIIKSHGVYTEASGLSRYSAIALLFLLFERKNYKKKLAIFILVINTLNLALSLSGSGIIILIAGFLYYFRKSGVSTKLLILFLIPLLILLFYAFKSTSILGFYLARIGELRATNTSGYYRFVLPFIIGTASITSNFLGYGIGNDEIAYGAYNALESTITNGFGKIFVETGIIGFCLMVYMYISLIPNYKRHSEVYTNYMLFLLISVFLNIVGSYMNSIMWSYILILCVNKNTLWEI